MEDFDKGCASSNQQLSQFNLPKWMANSNHMSQDQINSIQSQNNQSTHKDFQPENMIGCTQLSNSMKSNDERQLDATSVGYAVKLLLWRLHPGRDYLTFRIFIDLTSHP